MCWCAIKISILDEFWSITRSNIAIPRSVDPVGAIYTPHRHASVDIVYGATHRNEDTSKTFWPRLETPKDNAIKVEKPTPGQSSTIMKIFTPIIPIYMSLQSKIHNFPYRGFLCWLPSRGIHFSESSHRATPHLTCNAATYRFRDIRNRNFEF